MKPKPLIVVDSKDNLQDPNMRAEAISGTNLFGYKERQNTSDNEDLSFSDNVDETKRSRDNPRNQQATI